MGLPVLNATGGPVTLSTTTDPAGNLVGSTCVTDPNTGGKQSVSVLHVTDGNAPGAQANSALVGATLQLVNAEGTLDRAADAPGSTGVQAVSADGFKATYRYCGLALTPVATPTDLIIIQGSTSKTLRIKHIKLSGVATAQGNMPVQIVRRTNVGTLGSAILTTVIAAKHDPRDVNPSASVTTVGTANITTVGPSAGIEGVGRLGLPASGTGVAHQDALWDFSTRQDKALVVSGNADFICVNLNGAAVPAGGVIDFEIEIEEDNS
jgi:hypothetical protein